MRITSIPRLLVLAFSLPAMAADDALNWPAAIRECRPWSYWWWLGSAVDKTNLTRELQRYRAAGWGGVHIIPIYGAKGWEDRYIPYLSPKWMEMLRHTVTEAQRLDMGVDMTTGTGWCFGGPTVSDTDANATGVAKTSTVAAGQKLTDKYEPRSTQALMAFSPDGQGLDLTGKIAADGTVDWTAPGGEWHVYAISQRPSGQKVKRAAPGGEGHMLNLIHAPAIGRYLQRFADAFAQYEGPKPRAMYHDSYEYRSDWAPDLFAQFEKRRGYRLQNELPALFDKAATERAARVKCDYRETISDIMIEESLPAWVKWCHSHAILTRNQAHGSPGNLLDLYAAADIPETEMFNKDRSILVSKFASSAAHVTGKKLVAAETGTWLAEHFTETLAEVKYLLDDLFLAGVNQVVFHGTCYSPDEAGWPGWLFYASTEMNPRNSIWRDAPALASYIARCQSFLQAGRPDNDVLVYWPIHEFWQNPKGLARGLSVHARDWLEEQSIGRMAGQLWKRGYAFDYVSDRQLAAASAVKGKIQIPGGAYQVVVVPACERIPLPAMQKLLALAEAGALVIFEQQLPNDVPGWHDLANRQAELKKLIQPLEFSRNVTWEIQEATLGEGRILRGNVENCLRRAGVSRESLTDQSGLYAIRRAAEEGRCYFIANRGTNKFDGWITLAKKAESVVIMNPLTGQAGVGASRQGDDGTGVYLELEPGASIILRTLTNRAATGARWNYWQIGSESREITGSWQVTFLAGGPVLPAPVQTDKLVSWTDLGGEAAQCFAGTARYRLVFDAPAPTTANNWLLDLGKVCQSARVRLNDRDLGALIIPPFQVQADPLKPKDNVLEIEVTNIAANRIRDLDRRQVAWRNFHDINFVNLNYKPFDAANWPLKESGLLGPVRLLPLQKKPVTTLLYQPASRRTTPQETTNKR